MHGQQLNTLTTDMRFHFFLNKNVINLIKTDHARQCQ